MRRQPFADCGIKPRRQSLEECNALWARHKAGEFDAKQLAVELMPQALYSVDFFYRGRAIFCDAYGIEKEDLFGLAYACLVRLIEHHDEAMSSIRSRISSKIAYMVEDELRSIHYLPRSQILKGDCVKKISISAPSKAQTEVGLGGYEDLLKDQNEHGAHNLDLNDAIDGLRPYANDQEMTALLLYVCLDLTMRQAGEMLGLSESRVCQLIRKIRARASAGIRLDILEQSTVTIEDAQAIASRKRTSDRQRHFKRRQLVAA